MTNHPNRKSQAPCHHLMTTANARKQLAAAKAHIAKLPNLFGGMTITTTLDDGGKLSRSYVDSTGFQLTGDEEVNGFHRQLIISQTGYGLHARYTVTKMDSDRSVIWAGFPQTTEISDFSEALTKVLEDREAKYNLLLAVI